MEELDVVEILLWFWRTLSLTWSLTLGGLGLCGATFGEDLWRLDDDLDALLYWLMTWRLGARGASLDWTLGDLVDVELDVELIVELGAGDM